MLFHILVFCAFFLQPITWKSLIITFGLGGILLAGFKYAQKQKELGKYYSLTDSMTFT